MDGAREVVENALDSCLERNITDWGKIKTVVKDALSEFLWKRTKRSPMILAYYHGGIKWNQIQ